MANRSPLGVSDLQNFNKTLTSVLTLRPLGYFIMSKDSFGFSVFPIRTLVEDDHEEFYRLRLLGLKSNPEAFGEDSVDFERSTSEQIRERIRRSSSNSLGFILGVFSDRQLIGVAALSHSQSKKMGHRAHIWGVFVDPDFRGRGIAKTLMKAVLEKARISGGITQVDLSVTCVNTAAESLYRSVGFTEIGVDPGRLNINGTYHDEIMMIYDLRNLDSSRPEV